MKPYQIEGLAWLAKLHETGINGILADEMGLGKTLQTISLMAWLREFKGIHGPYLVIAPKTTLGNWVREVNKWCPVLRCFKFHGDQHERAEMIAKEVFPDKYDVFVTSYEVLIKEKATLCNRFFWQYVIIDEAHRIKNEASKLAITVRKLKTRFRLLVTGTPLQNNLHELWSLLNFLFPEMFNDSDEFDTLFNVTANSFDENETQEERESRNLQMVKQLHKVLRPFLLRRIKKEVSTELPPKKELLLYIGLTPMQRRLYKALLSKNFDVIGEKGVEGKSRLLNLVMQLRKCCNHPYLFEGWEDRTLDSHGEHLVENSGKLKLLDRLLKRLIANGSRILIFTQMTKMLDILEDFLLMREIPYCRIDGSTSGNDRDDAIDAFNAPNSEKKVFILSTRAGGLGINLVTADTVVIFDSDWNPQMDLQAMDRAHRIGQTKPVNVYRLVHENTVEQKMIERATLKLQLDSAIIQQGRASAVSESKKGGLNSSDLINMIQFGADHIFKANDGQMTDEDLDAVLSRGESLNQELNEKLSQHIKKSVLDFSSEAANSSVYEFEGEDYLAKRKQDRLAWLELSNQAAEEDREQKRLMRGIVERGGGGAGVAVAKNKLIAIPRALKLAPMHDFQFFDQKRLQALVHIEVESFLREKELQKRMTTVSSQISHAKDTASRIESLIEGPLKSLGVSPQRIVGASLDDDDEVEVVTADHHAPEQNLSEIPGGVFKINPADVLHPQVRSLSLGRSENLTDRLKECQAWIIELEKDLLGLQEEVKKCTVPAAVLEEKAQLLAAGFGDWQRKDFNAFIKGCELHGKENLSRVSRELDDKTEEEVTAYAKVFFSRFKEVAGWEKCLQKIEEGEARRRKNEELAEEISLRVQEVNCPWLQMNLPPPPATRGRAAPSNFFFTEENDRYLLTVTALLGFGRWEDIRAFIKRDPRVRFDWFLRTRSANDIGKRVDALVRLMKKERVKDANVLVTIGESGMITTGALGSHATTATTATTTSGGGALALTKEPELTTEQLALRATQQASLERRRRRAAEHEAGVDSLTGGDIEGDRKRRKIPVHNVMEEEEEGDVEVEETVVTMQEEEANAQDVDMEDIVEDTPKQLF
eukprot:GDKJ01041886.1.p1 GENE.GDKJ01041886.1~~GDKJ01041886.1.p1  ORF type:complete len:1214 (-),score=281.72 GDKJ01041886.1:82-3390(-)